MLVSDLMTRNVVTAPPSCTAAEASRLLHVHNIGALPVTTGGRLVGMITDRDITVRCVAANFDPNITRVRTVMSTGTVTASADQSPVEAARLMGQKQVRRLPVTENGRLVGMLSQGDLANAADRSGETAQAFRAVFDQLRTAEAVDP